MLDPLDLVRAFFRALNAGDLAAFDRLYAADCRIEHVFVDDDGVYQGSDTVCAMWADELARREGALPGGARVEVTRVAGIESGWGWVRADWVSADCDRSGGAPRHAVGHSHFWIEDGRIRRHRSVRRELAAPPDPGAPLPSSERQFPSRPIVGVGAVIVTSDHRVVLVKRTREPLAGQWSLPGGTLELGETLEAGTAREILEETGLVVDVGPVVDVFDRILVDDAGGVRYHFVLIDFLCRPRAGTPTAGSDVSAVILADPGDLARFHVADKARDVVARAMGMVR